jgi:hypothetical protein
MFCLVFLCRTCYSLLQTAATMQPAASASSSSASSGVPARPNIRGSFPPDGNRAVLVEHRTIRQHLRAQQAPISFELFEKTPLLDVANDQQVGLACAVYQMLTSSAIASASEPFVENLTLEVRRSIEDVCRSMPACRNSLMTPLAERAQTSVLVWLMSELQRRLSSGRCGFDETNLLRCVGLYLDASADAPTSSHEWLPLVTESLHSKLGEAVAPLQSLLSSWDIFPGSAVDGTQNALLKAADSYELCSVLQLEPAPDSSFSSQVEAAISRFQVKLRHFTAREATAASLPSGSAFAVSGRCVLVPASSLTLVTGSTSEGAFVPPERFELRTSHTITTSSPELLSWSDEKVHHPYVLSSFTTKRSSAAAPRSLFFRVDSSDTWY